MSDNIITDNYLNWADKMGVYDEALNFMIQNNNSELQKMIEKQKKEDEEFYKWIDSLPDINNEQ